MRSGQTGVQNNLVALHLAGNVPEHRQDLQRLAQGETMIRPSGPPAIDAALGISVSNGTAQPAPATTPTLGVLPGPVSSTAPSAAVPNEPVPAALAPSGPNAALNAAPWESPEFDE